MTDVPVIETSITCLKSAIETREKGVKICLNLTIMTPERRQRQRSGVFIVNFEHVNVC